MILGKEAGEISLSKQEIFSFQDPNYHTEFPSRLEAMRRENMLTDIGLKAGNVIIPCHKVALAAASHFFKKRINLEPGLPVIELKGVSPKVLEVIIDFIYTAKIEVCADLVKELIMSCDQLELISLKQACDNYIQATVQPANALGLFMLASKNHLENTLATAEECMMKRAEDIQSLSSNVEYASLSQDALIRWISADHLQVNTEDTVFKIVEKWVNADPGRNSDEQLEKIFSHVRFSLCTPKFLVQYVQKSPLLKYKKCQEFVEEAKSYVILKYINEKVEHTSQRTKPRNVITPISTTASVKSGMTSCPKQVLIGGVSNGVANNQCWYKEPDDQVWVELTKLPTGQVQYPYDFKACVLNDGFVISGGCTGARGGTCTCNAWHYSITSRRWQGLPPMIQARSGHGMVAVDSHVYVIGGQESGLFLTSVEKFDVSSSQWTNMAPLPHAVSGCHAILINGDIYLVASSDLKTQKYKVTANTWQNLKDPPESKHYSSIAGLGECIFVLGGVPAYQNMCYNTSTDTWTLLPAPAQTRVFGSALEHHGKVILCGGAADWTLHVCESSTEEYDPKSKQWNVSKLDLPRPLGGHFIIKL